MLQEEWVSRSVNDVVAHQVLTEVSLNEFLVCVAIEPAARLVNLLTVIDNPRLDHVFAQDFRDCFVQLREIVGIILLKSSLSL